VTVEEKNEVLELFSQWSKLTETLNADQKNQLLEFCSKLQKFNPEQTDLFIAHHQGYQLAQNGERRGTRGPKAAGEKKRKSGRTAEEAKAPG